VRLTAVVGRLGLAGVVGALALVGGSAGTSLAQGGFSATEMQLFWDIGRTPAGYNSIGQPRTGDVMEMTIEHFAEGKYADHYVIVDIEGQKGNLRQPGTFFFLYKPRLSLDKLMGRKMLPVGILGELYLAGQYSGSSNPYLRQAWCYGLSMDFAFQPNYGVSNLNVFIRDEDTQGLSYHIDYWWDQPFRIGKVDLDCKGFADLWENDSQRVFFAEPQLRVNAVTFAGPDSWIARASIGLEYEVTHNLYGYHYGWERNPGVFIAYPF